MRRGMIFLAIFATSACIGSSQPLYPDKKSLFVAKMPIRPGYYMKGVIYPGRGFSRDEDPVKVELKGSSYSLVKSVGYAFGDPAKSDIQQTQLFSNDPKSNIYIAQTPYRQVYIYNRVDTHEGGMFTIRSNKCNELQYPIEQLVSKTNAKVTRQSGICMMEDPYAVAAIIHMGKNWVSDSVDVYSPVPADRLVSLASLGAKLTPYCPSGDPEWPGPQLGGGAAPAAAHWRVMSVTDRSGATIESGFAIEAEGDTAGKWARLGSWDKATGKMGCGAAKYMNVSAFSPSANTISVVSDQAAAQKFCADRQLKSGWCGPHEKLIAAIQARGYRIMAQGYEYKGFPDRKLKRDGFLTVMGKFGKTDALFGIQTLNSGASVVIYNIGNYDFLGPMQ